MMSYFEVPLTWSSAYLYIKVFLISLHAFLYWSRVIAPFAVPTASLILEILSILIKWTPKLFLLSIKLPNLPLKFILSLIPFAFWYSPKNTEALLI